MKTRKGQIVKFNLDAMRKNDKEAARDINFQLLTAANGLKQSPRQITRQRVEANPEVTATVTGTADYGDWTNLIFEDGFECGIETKLLRRNQ
tara:strand:+ start:837 stop:1112 length:276 start_codon:yes stop_codon:yes gene_type:complete